MISGHGMKFFEDIIKNEVMIEATSKDPEIREAYRAVMVYLPTSFDQFVKFLP